MHQRRLIVTHHAPDLDAIGSVWMLKRFDAQHFADAKVAFVNPGDTITLEEAETFGAQLHEVTHVDTGQGEFDHHQPERGKEFICATSLTYDHVCKVHPDLADDTALATIAQYTTEIDHFKEIHWPEADNLRYAFTIQEMIRGLEFTDPHDDDSQLHFGMKCLDTIYAVLTQKIKADDIIKQDGHEFELPFGKALALETSNDDTIKRAQMAGFALVVRKDPKIGNVRIKLRPDASVDLKKVSEKILAADTKGDWFYHPGGKMFLNGSRKKQQTPSPLPLAELIALIKEAYAE